MDFTSYHHNMSDRMTVRPARGHDDKESVAQMAAWFAVIKGVTSVQSGQKRVRLVINFCRAMVGGDALVQLLGYAGPSRLLASLDNAERLTQLYRLD